MKVLKFGGTSLGSPERMKHVAELIMEGKDRKWVVLSAVSGTTNTLYEIVNFIKNGKQNEALDTVAALKSKYHEFILKLLEKTEIQKIASRKVNESISILEQSINKPFSLQLEKEIVAQGELISTQLFTHLLTEKHENVHLASALDFKRLNDMGEPDIPVITQNLKELEQKLAKKRIIVTQGFICRNQKGQIDNLKRGGSDFSASIIGACLNAEEVQIWTDIDGMHNNDPRVVNNTRPISKLTFDEAAELAYFGAKILHPSTILPARQNNVPVRIKNTMNPNADGTVISKLEPGWKGGVKAVAAKDGIVAIKIRSSRMLLAYGFLRRVFEIFEQFETPIDMITTSEVAVSLTIDNQEHLLEIVSTLEPFGEVIVDYDMTIICIVGNGIAEDKGTVSRIFHSLDEVEVRMISYGGSLNNISLLVKSGLKKKALEDLNTGLFGL